MSLGSEIRAFIRTNAAIEATVANRIRPMIESQLDLNDPDCQPPLIVYKVDKESSGVTLADGPDEYRRGTLELGIYGTDYDQVDDIAETMMLHLDDAGIANESYEIDFVYDGETDTEEAFPDGEESPIFVKVQNYSILYRIGDTNVS